MSPIRCTWAAVAGRLVAAGLLARMVAEAAQAAPAPALPVEPGRIPQPAWAQIYDGPMDFYVATGPADTCGPGCSEWIAADGKLDHGAGNRFKEFLNSPRRRSLPVFFHSPGGILSDGIEVAKLLREYQMTAGVARTTPTGCTTQRLRGGVCDRMIKSGNDVPSRIELDRGQCHSACVFALVGATQRKIAAGARIGVHSPRTDEILWKRYLDQHPGATRTSSAKRHLGLWRMVLAMGVDPELVNVAAKTESAKLHMLSRDEINRFGLETREQFETPWRTNPDTTADVRLLKLVNATGSSNSGIGPTATIALSCRTESELILTYQRKVLTYEPVEILQVSLTGGKLNRKLDGRTAGSLGVWGTVVGFGDLRHAAENAAIRIVETYPNHPSDGAPLGVTLSSAEIAPALSELQKSCNARNVSAVTTGRNAD